MLLAAVLTAAKTRNVPSMEAIRHRSGHAVERCDVCEARRRSLLLPAMDSHSNAPVANLPSAHRYVLFVSVLLKHLQSHPMHLDIYLRFWMYLFRSMAWTLSHHLSYRSHPKELLAHLIDNMPWLTLYCQGKALTGKSCPQKPSNFRIMIVGSDNL